MVSISQIDIILQAEDIEGLLILGAPKDEYSNEAASIGAALKTLEGNEVNERVLCDLIAKVWNTAFGPFDAEEINKRSAAFQRVAAEMLRS